MEAVRHKVIIDEYDEKIEEPKIPEPLYINESEISYFNKNDDIDMIIEQNMILENQINQLQNPQDLEVGEVPISELLSIEDINKIRSLNQVNYPSLCSPADVQLPLPNNFYLYYNNMDSKQIDKLEVNNDSNQNQNTLKQNLLNQDQQFFEDQQIYSREQDYCVIRKTLKQKQEILKQQLKNAQETLLEMIPESEKEKVKKMLAQPVYTNFAKSKLSKSNLTPGQDNLKVLEDKNLKIVEKIEMEIINGVEQGVRKQYIVYKVDGMKDTLLQISYKFRVSKREIQQVNQFSGDDIYYFKELLIPYKGQSLDIPQFKQDDQAASLIIKNQSIKILAEQIKKIEKQNYQRIIKKDRKENFNLYNFESEATYYLEQNQYDIQKALQEYKQDLQNEDPSILLKNQNQQRKKSKKCLIF